MNKKSTLKEHAISTFNNKVNDGSQAKKMIGRLRWNRLSVSLRAIFYSVQWTMKTCYQLDKRCTQNLKLKKIVNVHFFSNFVSGVIQGCHSFFQQENPWQLQVFQTVALVIRSGRGRNTPWAECFSSILRFEHIKNTLFKTFFLRLVFKRCLV